MRIRNRNEVAWSRLDGAKRPPPKNPRQERLSQAFYGETPRRHVRLILESE